MGDHNHEVPVRKQDNLWWRALWLTGKIAFTLGAGASVQYIVHTQTGYYIPTNNMLLIVVFVVIAIKLWA